MSAVNSKVGVVLGSALSPEDITGAASAAERLGFGEIWLAEDYFFTGGISAAAAVLGATEKVPVGLGIVSAMVRHPAVLAMEISTLARMHPGRLLPGIGLGLPNWVQQMNLHPRSTLGALRECLSSVSALLAGEELTVEGDYFQFDKVRLTYPVDGVPLYMGVIGPKMLTLAGEIADGTVLSVLASPTYVRWARERIAEGMARGSRDQHHKLCTFALCSVDPDRDTARQVMRPVLAFYLAAVVHSPLVSVLGITEDVLKLAEGGSEALAEAMPDEWIDQLAIAGTPDDCVEKINDLLEAGSDTVALFPVPSDRALEVIELAGTAILPRCSV